MFDKNKHIVTTSLCKTISLIEEIKEEADIEIRIIDLNSIIARKGEDVDLKIQNLRHMVLYGRENNVRLILKIEYFGLLRDLKLHDKNLFFAIVYNCGFINSKGLVEGVEFDDQYLCNIER